MMKQDKKRILTTTVFVGIVCVIIVVLAAYCAELKLENNYISTKNETLQGEIDTLNVKIKTANNIEHIEYIATKKIGMIYPNSSECIYVTDKDAPDENFAMTIKEQAYN